MSIPSSLSGRTTMILSCSAALGALVPVALYQLGAISHLPDPPGSWFDSDRITSSKDAHPFDIPDSLLGLVSYGTTLALILSAPKSRLMRRLLAAKLVIDGAMASMNAVKQVVEFKSLCSWCMITTGATAVLVPAGRGLLENATKQLKDGVVKTVSTASTRRIREAFSA